MWVLGSDQVDSVGQVHVTLSRIAAVASLAADELNTASSLLEITLAYSLPLRFAKLSKIASHNSPGCNTVLLPTWSSDIVLIPIGGVCV